MCFYLSHTHTEWIHTNVIMANETIYAPTDIMSHYPPLPGDVEEDMGI